MKQFILSDPLVVALLTLLAFLACYGLGAGVRYLWRQRHDDKPEHVDYDGTGERP